MDAKGVISGNSIEKERRDTHISEYIYWYDLSLICVETIND